MPAMLRERMERMGRLERIGRLERMTRERVGGGSLEARGVLPVPGATGRGRANSLHLAEQRHLQQLWQALPNGVNKQ